MNGVDRRLHADAKQRWANLSNSRKNALMNDKRKAFGQEAIGTESEKTSYGEWLARRPEAEYDEILGKAKADAFRNGATIESFVDLGAMKSYTLAPLWASEPEYFDGAKSYDRGNDAMAEFDYHQPADNRAAEQARSDKFYAEQLSEADNNLLALTPEMRQAVSDYTDWEIGDKINDSLRRGKKLDPIGEARKIEIDHAFAAIDPHKKELILFRTVSFDQELPLDKNIDQLGFCSTSISPFDASKFYRNNKFNYVLRLKIKPGTKILAVKSVSKKPRENEELLNRDGKIRIISVNQNPDLRKYVSNGRHDFIILDAEYEDE